MSSSIEPLLEAARKTGADRDWAAGLGAWEAVRDAFPERVEGYCGVGLALRELGRLDESDAVLAATIARFPDAAEPAMQFSWTAERRRDWEEARRRWQAMGDRLPSHYAPPLGVGVALIELGRFDDADQVLSATLERSPGHKGAALFHARSAIRRRDWGEAEARVATFLSRFPDAPEKPALVRELGFLRRMDDMSSDAAGDAARPVAAVPEPEAAFSVILKDFDSIGSNCEFAFLQRECGLEPISLLRFAGIGVADLLDALDQGFAGVDDPENFRLNVSPSGEYFTSDVRWKMVAHTFYQASAVEEKAFYKSQIRRIKYLRDKFLEDLASPDRCLVYQRYARLDDDEILSLFAALRRHGPNALLCVRKAEAGRPAGTVEAVRDGLMVGYISELCPPGVTLPLVPRWKELCETAHRLWLEGARKPAGGDYAEAEIDARNADALARAQSLQGPLTTRAAAPKWTYNHFIAYGQSLAVGVQAWPAKSTAGRPDVLMLGESVVSPGRGTTFAVVGDPSLRPMVATVLSMEDGTVMPASAVAKLPADAANHGETPLEGALLFARDLFLRAEPDAGDRVFVGSSAGVGGAPIEHLSKGADPDLFNRLRSAASRVKTIAAEQGKSYGIVGLFLFQGEANYSPRWGFTTDKDAYRRLLDDLFEDFCVDVVEGIVGQAERPVVLTYQTSGYWAEDGLGVAQAQYELSLESPGWFLAAPCYPVTDKGTHLDANGSRWLGLQFGKVWHRVVVEKRGWRPTSPLRATWRGATLLIDFHVPVPPLRFEPVWERNAARMFEHLGFSVRDAAGEVPLSRVTIVADAVVAITCGRDLAGPAEVFYGRKTGSNGAGNLCDSDRTPAPLNFTYEPGSGDFQSVDIPDLVGKPYPLWNWCVAFALPATAD